MPSNSEAVARGHGPARPSTATEALRSAREQLGPLLAGSVLPFVLVVYLALEGGGYDAIVRSELGVAVWWIVLLGALIGVFPMARVSRLAWAGMALLAAFAAWTALGISWSESSERSVAELARVASYLGVLALAVATQGREGLRRTVCSVGAGLALVGGLALLSRLHPSWFPANETAAAFDFARSRLNYPVNYWNGLAALMAIGVPLVLAIAVDARRIAAQAIATAAVPAMALTAFFTLSRGGAVEMAVGLSAFVFLYPRRLAALPTLLLAGGASALLIAAATQRNALEDGLTTQAALNQGDEMLAMTVVVCVGVGLIRAAVGLAARHGIGPRVHVSRSSAAAGFAAVLVVALFAFVLAGGPGQVSNTWEEFKQPGGVANDDTAARFASASGNGRYQWWQAALDASSSEPLTGIGPGTYEYFWAQHGTIPGFVRDAHSLFLESLAEVGVIGFLLISALIFGVIALGAWRSFSAAATQRGWFAGATAGAVAFAAAAAIDWAWELAVIPLAFMLLAAAVLSQRDGEEPAPAPSSRVPRVALAAFAVLALAAIAIPLATTSSVRASQDEVKASQLGPALERAQEASQIQPWAATPRLQEALVLELQGDLDGATAAARAATEDEPTNWRTWLTLSRLEAYRGDAEASVAAYREARSLNPRSALFSP